MQPTIIIKTPFSILTITLIMQLNLIRPWIFLWIPINSMARYAKHMILTVESNDQSKPYLSYLWGLDHLRFSSHLGPGFLLPQYKVFSKRVNCLNTIFLNQKSLRAWFFASSWDGMVKQPLIMYSKIEEWGGSQSRYQ